MRKVICFICCLFAGILPLAAQTDSDSDSPRNSGRSAWFACISIPDGLENPVKVMAGKEFTELKLLQYMASDPVRIPVDGVMRIVREVADAENQGKMKPIVLAEAKIPENVREALILLMPLPKPDGDLIFLTKVQDLAAFKGGDRLFINLSDTNIRVRLGGDTVTVTPGQADIYQSPALTKPANSPIMYEFYHPEDSKWKMLSASTVVLRPTRREICVFNSGSRLGNIKKHKILFPVQVTEP